MEFPIQFLEEEKLSPAIRPCDWRLDAVMDDRPCGCVMNLVLSWLSVTIQSGKLSSVLHVSSQHDCLPV